MFLFCYIISGVLCLLFGTMITNQSSISPKAKELTFTLNILLSVVPIVNTLAAMTWAIGLIAPRLEKK